MRLVGTQIATSFFLKHFNLVDKHTGKVEIDLGLACLGVRHMTKKHGSLLGLHHNEFEETLCHFTGLCGGLDFGHRELIFGLFFNGWEHGGFHTGVAAEIL